MGEGGKGRQIKHVWLHLPWGVNVQMARWKLSSPLIPSLMQHRGLVIPPLPPYYGLWSLIYRPRHVFVAELNLCLNQRSTNVILIQHINLFTLCK